MSCRSGRRRWTHRALALLGLLVLAGADAPATSLTLASTPWAPFTDDADHARFALDLVHEALRRAEVDATSVILADTAWEPAIRAGTYQGSAAMWKTEAREAWLVFSDAYLQNRLVLIARKGTDVSATRFDQLAGRRVGIVGAYAYGADLDAAAPTFVRGADHQENLDRLLSGDLDYVLIDDLLVRYLVRRHPDAAGAKLAVGTTPLLIRPLHLAIRRDVPGAEDIVRRFDEQMHAMIADGTYNRILALPWILADVDHDGRAELVAQGPKAGTTAPSGGYPVLLGAASGNDLPSPRFWIDGQAYESWSAIPDRYKQEGPPPMVPSGTAGLRIGF